MLKKKQEQTMKRYNRIFRKMSAISLSSKHPDRIVKHLSSMRISRIVKILITCIGEKGKTREEDKNDSFYFLQPIRDRTRWRQYGGARNSTATDFLINRQTFVRVFRGKKKTDAAS